MYPELLKINVPEGLQGFLPEVLTIFSYGFFIGLGVLFAFYIMLRRLNKYGVDGDQLSSLFIYGFLAAFLGGKIFYYLQEPYKYLDDPSLLFKSIGNGFVFYGSLLFAVPVLGWWAMKKKIPLRAFLDNIAFIGPVLHGFGRIGCLMSGCCYGKLCDNALGITFTNTLSKARPLNTPLYPTQLFDIILNISILAILFYFEKKKKFNGQLFLIYIVLYAVGRSIVEIYRGDTERGFIIGAISHSQFIAIILIMISCFFWNKWKKEEANQLA